VVENSPLKIFNANAASFFDSVTMARGLITALWRTITPTCINGSVDHKDTDYEKARLLADFITEAAMIEMRLYPVSAKYHNES
jgi:4-hydroxy-tetrahydrodipicolinate synthase